MKALYENGWFHGDVLYFNSKLEEFKVKVSDGSFDYPKKEDIDGIEVVLL